MWEFSLVLGSRSGSRNCLSWGWRNHLTFALYDFLWIHLLWESVETSLRGSFPFAFPWLPALCREPGSSSRPSIPGAEASSSSAVGCWKRVLKPHIHFHAPVYLSEFCQFLAPREFTVVAFELGCIFKYIIHISLCLGGGGLVGIIWQKYIRSLQLVEFLKIIYEILDFHQFL